MSASLYHPVSSISPGNREEQGFEDFLSGLMEFESETIESEIPKLNTHLSGKDKSPFKDQTIYVDINLGFSHEDQKYCPKHDADNNCIKYSYVSSLRSVTAIYHPSSIDLSKSIDLLFYFHGYLKDRPGVNSDISDYLNAETKKNGALNIRETIEQSGLNILLIAPTLGPSSQAAKLLTEKGWKRYREDVLDAVTEYMAKKSGKSSISIGKTILAAHSGGGKPMLTISKYAQPDEVWGFDSIYQGGQEKKTPAATPELNGWADLAIRFPSANFIFYSSNPGSTMRAQLNGICLRKNRTAGEIPNLRLIDIAPLGHFDLIRVALNNRLHILAGKSNPTEKTVDCMIPKQKLKASYYEDHYFSPGKGNTYRPRPAFEFESILDEMLHEIGLEYEHSAANTAFREKLADAALAEYANWGNGSKVETDRDMYNSLTGFYADGIQEDYIHGTMTAKKVKSIVDQIQKLVKPPIDPKTKKRKPTPYWSAAFISWVHRKAIGSRAIPFLYSMAHVWYVSRAKQATKTNDSTYPFRAYDFNKVKPEKGDLICNTRQKGVTFKNIDNGKGWALHCDVVVDVTETEVYAIGGNAQDQMDGKKSNTVGKKKIALDANGFIKQKAKNKYIAIVKYTGEE